MSRTSSGTFLYASLRIMAPEKILPSMLCQSSGGTVSERPGYHSFPHLSPTSLSRVRIAIGAGLGMWLLLGLDEMVLKNGSGRIAESSQDLRTLNIFQGCA